ncbi:Serine/threonine-protein kinase ULK1 [Colletotrichum gloeosporioides]|uniref:Serine/threonine-protein kinase ULK1 n=1 Tax=Colletotrichum gloeosporioides TaxID=474922 RepID=A0A8H4CUJ1_COLGL|nr:Serine/threonine-protein kinase ULK1 [Colletotrichum gloeosporioides]KAF3810403.1 Serine/threonine-protein kinase ULK1 [Colletotrichum gloeosporioides]
MGDRRRALGSEEPSEEKTEPFSQTEIDRRLGSIRVDEPLDLPQPDAVPLDQLRVEEHHHKQGIRILVRPLTRSRSVSPGNYNCQWLALRAEVASEQEPQHKVLAVTQTSKDIKFSVRIPPERLDDDNTPRPPLWCELYYDPASDNQILLNRSEVPISLTRISDGPSSCGWTVNPGTPKALSPGTWRINVRETSVLDFRVLAKRPAFFRQDSDLRSEPDSGSGSDALNASGKRSFTLDAGADPARTEKKPRTADEEDGVIMFLRPAAKPLVFPLPTEAKTTTTGTSSALVPANGHALLDMQSRETVAIPGGCEIDEYTVTKRDQIASTALSSVFTAEHSNVPDGIVTVKVLKTRAAAPSAANPAAKPQDNNERNVIRQADMWLREYQSQDDLRHESIVKLYGGDARYLSLYMEHVDAKDLAAKGVWRNHLDHSFTGTRADAFAILRDIAGALHYLHSKSLVHNDIKPANILYSPSRGAVLCDFGLSTHTSGPVTTGGTPYYIPPEFIGKKLRGPPSDVWALGVTMLYVLGKIPFPDARSRKGGHVGGRPLYWMIADVNRTMAPPPMGTRPPCAAVDMMYIWLSEVAQAREKLYPRDKLERLVSDMLIPLPSQRITMARVMRELFLVEQSAVKR